MRARFVFNILCAIFLLTIIAAPGGLSTLARAQEGGLTGEQLALLDRIFSAQDNFKNYPSFVETANATSSMEMVLTIEGEAQSSTSAATWGRTATVIQGEAGMNVSAVLTAISRRHSDTGLGGFQGTQTAVVNLELRFVDGSLYVLGAYGPGTIPGPNLAEMPEGWVRIDDLGNFPVFQEFNLDDYLSDTDLFDDQEMMEAAALDVTVEASTLADGTPVDVITVTFGPQGLAMLLGEQQGGGQLMTLIMNSIDESSGGTLTITLDAENNPYSVSYDILAKAVGMDATVFGGQFPAGSTLDFITEGAREEAYSQIGEMFEPATVPEGM